MTFEDFDALAERILLAMAGKGDGYTPPKNVYMLSDSAIALAEHFSEALHKRRVGLLGDVDLTSTEVDAIKDGRIIDAIKFVRNRTGMTLRDSKAHVDEARQKMGSL